MKKPLILIIIIIILVLVGYWWYQLTLTWKAEGSKECITDQDCVVFGKTGDCNCGCYNKDNLPSRTGGECFCLAPVSCKCIDGRCEGIFEELMTVKVFFNNSEMDPEFSCNKVFPVERVISKTQAVARASLEELLKGASDEEKAEGYLSSINSGVKIQSLSIENGTAKVDFDEQLEFQAGGSCRVAAIRAQITETLKQFPTVNDVIISINGRTEDILQP